MYFHFLLQMQIKNPDEIMNIAKVANELDGQLLKIVTSNMANHFIRIRIYLGMQLQIGK